MSAKVLIGIGLVWLLLVALWITVGDKSFAVFWRAPSPAKRALIMSSAYALLLIYQLFLIGWLVPLILGAYRLLRHR